MARVALVLAAVTTSPLYKEGIARVALWGERHRARQIHQLDFVASLSPAV